MEKVFELKGCCHNKNSITMTLTGEVDWVNDDDSESGNEKLFKELREQDKAIEELAHLLYDSLPGENFETLLNKLNDLTP